MWAKLVASWLGALCLCACISGYSARFPLSQSPYDQLDAPALAALTQARERLAARDFPAARNLLESLRAQHPESIYVGIWLQELELAEQGLDALPRAALSDPLRSARAEELLREWRRIAEQQPSAANFVLAARLEQDPSAARSMLARAASLDPACPWVPYARAFLAARERDWPTAARELNEALRWEPGHRPSRWLQAWTLARGGDPKEARARLATWLEATNGDPRIETRMRAEAELDLALLEMLEGDPAAAARSLEKLQGSDLAESARILCARASAAQARGEFDLALRLADEASRVDPEAMLPLVQRAILEQRQGRDLERAYALWAEVERRAGASREFSAVLEQLRARVEQERLERAANRARSEP